MPRREVDAEQNLGHTTTMSCASHFRMCFSVRTEYGLMDLL
jgi:hypothetical protein